jgi:hypothetical protein
MALPSARARARAKGLVIIQGGRGTARPTPERLAYVVDHFVSDAVYAELIPFDWEANKCIRATWREAQGIDPDNVYPEPSANVAITIPPRRRRLPLPAKAWRQPSRSRSNASVPGSSR